MNDSVDSNVGDPEKPVSPSQSGIDIFPPFPDATDADFEEDIGQEERDYYKLKYIDLNDIKGAKLHCTACDRHLGCLVLKSNRIKTHPMLRTLVCNTCHTFYNSGEFEKGDDGSELYCRWCGQGGQVYCCSDCPHVFCAKCIKRNLGISKIKEIENTDDWKCFKCTPRCLWDLRALCWATFRYCDFKNKIIDTTTEKELKDKYLKAVENDAATCCREKRKRLSAAASKKKEEKADTKKKNDLNTDTKPPMIKFPSTIQVKKFASINLSEMDGGKKAQKRPASPKNKINYMSKPIAIAPFVQPIRQVYSPSPAKRIRAINPIRQFTPVNKSTFIGFPPRMMRPNPQMAIPFNNMLDQSTNGFNFMDHLNLSIENLTQGLDMGAVAALSAAAAAAGPTNMANDDLVCTPDLPLEHLEPLCEVNEDNTDDDVECISPAPAARNAVKVASKPAKLYKNRKVNEDNIVQMTENDVTVNAVTGGLKFRVDPQTLSSNKMYRLPDGRIFAINSNPNMPGGYSATIVALTDNSTTNVAKGTTYAAKVSAVNPVPSSNPPPLNKLNRANAAKPKRRRTPATPAATGRDDTPKKLDFKVPVEWYRFNLVDAVDALEYSLMRLKKLKKEASTTFLRSRTVDEARFLTRTLDRLLNTSETRFAEVRKNLNKDFKQYLSQKQRNSVSVHESDDEDDDDVEILPDEDDDPIFIDENSNDSHKDGNDTQEVELVSSDLNDSEERNKSTTNTSVKGIIENSAKDSSNSKNEDPLTEDKQDSETNVPNNTEKSLDNENLNKEKNKNDKHDEESDDIRKSDKQDLTNNQSHRTDEAGDESQNDVEMSEIVDNSFEGEDDLLASCKDDANKVDKDDANEADKGDGNEADEGKAKEADKVDGAEMQNNDKDKSVKGNCLADDEPDAVGDADQTDHNDTTHDSEMHVDEGNAGENESKSGDVDMSADIIDSLLNDEAFAQDVQNDDDNKSVESGEFII